MKYEKLFDSLSASVWGKILAATAIGALAGLGAARKMSGSGQQLGWGWVAGAGAAIGLVAGLLLGLAEIRAKRVAAGTSKPLSGMARVGVVAGALVAFIAVCLVIVFGPSFRLGGSSTPRLRPEFAMPETERAEGDPSQPPHGDPTRRPTGAEPLAGATDVTPVTPVLPPPAAERVDRQPLPTTEPEVAILPPPEPPANPASVTTPPAPPIQSKPPVQSPAQSKPPAQSPPPAKPAAPLAAKPTVAAGMQSVAGKWRLNKTVTTTLIADGSLKTNYSAIRDGKWTLTGGDTVTIYTSKGVAVYTFKLDESGTAGTGSWKDGSKASPAKMD